MESYGISHTNLKQASQSQFSSVEYKDFFAFNANSYGFCPVHLTVKNHG